jgi:hypothetical protein
VPVPFVPSLQGGGDTSCFDAEFTRESAALSTLKVEKSDRKQCEKGFPGFSFTAEKFCI